MNEKIRVWAGDPLDVDVKRALERLASSDDVVRVAVMPDVHLAEDVCVGVAVATTHSIYPSAVGGDIGCGMAAVRLDVAADTLDRADVAARILAGFELAVPILAQRRPLALSIDPAPLAADVLRTAARQLGTLGRGNHFLELQVDDDDGAVWLTVHSGSRGAGQAIRDRALARCRTSAAGLGFLVDDSDDGRAYLAEMRWALAFADASRRAIVDAACAVLGDVAGAAAVPGSYFACEHNHVERVGELWIHRKGAISAAAGVRGIIPGSMGASTFHVVGRGHAEALWSSSHGAGRAMSRTEARKRIRVADLKRDVRGLWFDHRKVARLVDEAPGAYKDISKVMRAQSELTRIVRRLRPILSYKGC